MLGPGGELQCSQARVDGRDRSCPNVGGICIGCTMPGFPDKFMPFMNQPPGARVSTGGSSAFGRGIRALRSITQATLNKEPKWRHTRAELTTGYHGRS